MPTCILQVRDSSVRSLMTWGDIECGMSCQECAGNVSALVGFASLSVAFATSARCRFRENILIINYRTRLILFGLEDPQNLSFSDSSRCASAACVDQARYQRDLRRLVLGLSSASMCLIWPGVLKTRAVPFRILRIDRYSKALSGPANNAEQTTSAGTCNTQSR
jgi:hypothetical protein